MNLQPVQSEDPLPPRRIRVKFCGMTRPADAAAAARLGVDAIGLVFVPRSRRFVTIEQAVEICAAVPAMVEVVGLFMDAEPAAIEHVLMRVPLNLLQFHGNESPADCARFRRPFWKALPMASPGQVHYSEWDAARALLLDAHAAGDMGGSGRSIDWQSLRPPARPWVLAGGLSPDNVEAAIAALAPPALDVSSGIESAPGRKSATLMQRFMEKVNND